MTYYPTYSFFGFGVNDDEAEEILGNEWVVTCSCDGVEENIVIPVATVSYESHDSERNYPYYCATWTCDKCGKINKDDEGIISAY